jgi:SAM-dependent methyltransferase
MAMTPRGSPISVDVTWNGEPLGPALRVERSDLREHLYWLRSAAECGFTTAVHGRDAHGRLEFVGRWGNGAMARMATTFLAPHLEDQSVPPESLSERVSDLSGDTFRLSGLQAFTDVWDQVQRFRRDPRQLAFLDWGCGCGRISRYLARVGVKRLVGCDLDSEAVRWCAANLRGDFRSCSPDPPLPLGDGEIDIAIASSVFTHLDRDRQQHWLAELRRVLRPGGLLIASVAGLHAYMLGPSRLIRPREKPGSLRARAVAARRRARLRRARIIDGRADPHLDGIAPAGYYRMVYETREFVEQAWTRDFAVVNYLERGLSGHQDLVVLRACS